MKFIINALLKIPIGVKISVNTIVIVATSIIILASILFENEKEIINKEMQKKGTVVLRNLSESGLQAIINDDKATIGGVIDDLVKDIETYNLLYCIIYDKKSIVFEKSLAANIKNNFNLSMPNEFKSITKITSINRKINNINTIDMAAPIVLASKKKTKTIGYARIGISKAAMEKAIEEESQRVVILAIIFIAIAIAISFIFAITITRPIKKKVRVMDKVAEGDLNQEVKVWVRDEIGTLASSFNHMIQGLREHYMMQKYISTSTIDMIKQKKDTDVKLGGEDKDVTIFFSDIRGFTSYSENKKPEQVINMLNQYLSFQAEIIYQYKGSVDKFVGDEVMAIFEGEDKVERCLNASIDILKRVAKENEGNVEKINIGIGVHTGHVVMGNMGSKDRMDYTVIGDNVNTAARLCDKAKPGTLLISHQTAVKSNKKFKMKNPTELSVKGKAKVLKVYEVAF